MSFKASVIDLGFRWLVGADWPLICQWVSKFEWSRLSGAQRKAEVLDILSRADVPLQGVLLNFAIEAAVIGVRTRFGQPL